MHGEAHRTSDTLDLRTSVGTVSIPKGFEVTEAFLERTRNFGPGILQERVRVSGAGKQGS